MDYVQIRRIYTYDQLNRLSSVSSEDSLTATYQYDGAGNLVTVTQGEKKLPLLVGISGEYAGCDLELDNNWIILGRDPARCQLVFNPDTATVGPIHCRIRFDDQRQVFQLQDLKSSAETYLPHGQKIDPESGCDLRHGDRFWLGAEENIGFEVRLGSR